MGIDVGMVDTLRASQNLAQLYLRLGDAYGENPACATRLSGPTGRRKQQRKQQQSRAAQAQLEQGDDSATSFRSASAWRAASFRWLSEQAVVGAGLLRDLGLKTGDRVALFADHGESWISSPRGDFMCGCGGRATW